MKALLIIIALAGTLNVGVRKILIQLRILVEFFYVI
jgi:hypothetical protein